MDSDYNNLTYREAVEYHKELRQEIFNDVEKTYATLNLSASEISFNNVVEANGWKKIWKKTNRVAGWDWVRLYNEYHSRGGARRFDMALSKNGSLVSLCYGMMERSRIILRLHAIENSPLNSTLIANNSIKINLYAANLYGALNGASEIWICDPVSPAHVRLYRSKGYTPHENHQGKVTCLVAKI